jgi:hypothetical protein
MCLPAPPDDPERYRVKVRNLSAVAGNFRAAGCAAVVVSGDLGPSKAISPGTVSSASLTICRLRASPHELRRRLTSRHEGPDFVSDALHRAEELDRSSFADACVDTDGLTVAEVARLVRERCGGWPPGRVAARADDAAQAPADDVAPAPTPSAVAGGNVLLVCGATGVGKSEAGFGIYLRQSQAGVPSAYVDLDQIGLMSPLPADDPGGHRLKARNLAALWRAFHEAGARRLILSGPVADEDAVAAYAAALPAAGITVCRLHAGPDELARRIALRGHGLSWPQPGDPLAGQPEAHLWLAAAESAAQAEALERAGLGDLCIYTDGRTIAEVVDLIAGASEWPPAGPRR